MAGGYGADTYYWNWGDGWDYINDEGTDDGIDKIVFGEGITFKDLTFTKDYSGYFQIIVKGDKTQGIELPISILPAVPVLIRIRGLNSWFSLTAASLILKKSAL